MKGIVNYQGFPFPIPNLPFWEQRKMMTTFFDTVVEEGAKAPEVLSVRMEFGVVVVVVYIRPRSGWGISVADVDVVVVAYNNQLNY